MKPNSMKVSNTIMSSLGSNCKLKRSSGCHDLRKLLDLYVEQEKNEGNSTSTSTSDDENLNASSSSSVIDNYQDGNASTFDFSKLSEVLNDAKENANVSSDANKDVTTTTTYLKLPEFSKLSEALMNTETQETLVGLKLFHVPVLRYKHYLRRHSTSW